MEVRSPLRYRVSGKYAGRAFVGSARKTGCRQAASVHREEEMKYLVSILSSEILALSPASRL